MFTTAIQFAVTILLAQKSISYDLIFWLNLFSVKVKIKHFYHTKNGDSWLLCSSEINIDTITNSIPIQRI